MNTIVSLFADGGCITRNPSTLGGTWAWVAVNAAGVRVAERSGSITPADIGMGVVTNNVTELLAAVEALEAREPGWSGTLATDSGVTFKRLRRPEKAGMKGVPVELVARLKAAVKRAGRLTLLHLSGHPTAEQLRAGVGKHGLPVSVHNVRCDKLCTEAALAWKARNAPRLDRVPAETV